MAARSSSKGKRTTKRIAVRRSKKADINKNFLKDAIVDVQKELKRLTSSKKFLGTKLGKTNRSLLATRAREDGLRDTLSKLISREGKIREVQHNIKQSISNVKSRVLRVKKIKDELSESD